MNAHAVAWRFIAYPSSKLGVARMVFRTLFADAVVSFGGPAPRPRLVTTAKRFSVPIFIIWAGTDVMKVIDGSQHNIDVASTDFIHLSVAPWLSAELQRIGILAPYVPLTGMIAVPAIEIPRDFFGVWTYLPEPRRDFYGKAHVFEVARKLPDIEFTIVGPGAPDTSAPSNVHFRGWISDMTTVINRNAVLLRVPDHDGMSLSVLESLALGRYVAWNHPLQGVQQVATPDDTVNYLRGLHELHRTGKLAINQEGIKTMTTIYEERNVALGVERFFQDAIKRGR